ncbi:acyltransferase family protein [Lederbergia citrea]|uniref:Acyltransferase family protein n=1 Tax=Lederbergia citrea TaxID=2833581 RepID=A0A942UGT0_9BACI|nr:acyltransferase family protein [Lederbergia citrea]MBS4204260.1 acyltransferase family protein [Lederbergia citrea]MBS4221155.1 acyltransferase family protein [Lederbergia citrea]
MNGEEKLARRYDIDWLRNLGILLLFPFHSARVFDHWDPFYVKSDVLSWGLTWFVSMTSYWFMPLLFWLAGSASWYALSRRSNRQYIKDRFSRLFIPLLFGVFIIVPPQGYFAKLHHTGETVGSYINFLKTFFTDFSDLSGYFGTFTPAHLWFILYLFVLSLIALPFFSFVINKKRHHTIEKFNVAFSQPIIFILFFIVLVFTQILPAPGGQNPFYFLVIFIMGFITCSHQAYQEMFNRIRFKALILMLILVPTWMFLMYQNQDALKYSTIDISLTFLRMFNVWLSLIILLGYGNKFLNFPSKLLPYLNEAAFPIYIIHQSVLVVIGYFVLKLNISTLPMFLMIMLLTLAISLLVYEFIIKRTAFTRWVFGVKIRKVTNHVDNNQIKSSL